MENKLVTIDTLAALSNVEVTKEVIESEDFSANYEALNAAIKQLSAAKDAINKKISEVIQPMYAKDGTTTLVSNKYNFTYCAPTTSLNVDSTKLKKEYPDVYNKCVKVSNRAGSLRVTERKDGEDNA
jgi:predicted phage-related endonuclease